MIKKTRTYENLIILKISDLKNYFETLQEIIDWYGGDKYKTHRWNLCKKIEENYRNRKYIEFFFNEQLGWVHFIGQSRFSRRLYGKMFNRVKKTRPYWKPKLKRIFLKLYEENNEKKVDWDTEFIEL